MNDTTSQRAREAVAQLLPHLLTEGILEGAKDSLSVVQAFARIEAEALARGRMEGAKATMTDPDWIATTGPAEWPLGTACEKASGPQWRSVVIGYYSSTFTPQGLVLECQAVGALGQVHVEPAKRMIRYD